MSDDADAKPPEYYTVAELATLLRVHESTVRKWIECGVLSALKPLGTRVVRIHASEVNRFISCQVTIQRTSAE